MRFVEFLIKGLQVAQRMVSKGLDEYTIYLYKTSRDQDNGRYAWKIVHSDFDAAKGELEDITMLFPDMIVVNDFESLV